MAATSAILRVELLMRVSETVAVLTETVPSDNVSSEHRRKQMLTDLNKPIRAKEDLEH